MDKLRILTAYLAGSMATGHQQAALLRLAPQNADQRPSVWQLTSDTGIRHIVPMIQCIWGAGTPSEGGPPSSPAMLLSQVRHKKKHAPPTAVLPGAHNICEWKADPRIFSPDNPQSRSCGPIGPRSRDGHGLVVHTACQGSKQTGRSRGDGTRHEARAAQLRFLDGSGS